MSIPPTVMHERAALHETLERDGATKAPLGNVAVTVYNAKGVLVAFACTISDGSYTINSLGSGTYSVGFDVIGPGVACNKGPTNYVPQYYNDKPSLGQADPVAVTAGSTTSPIDAALQSGQGSISGTVTDAATGAALDGIPVQLFSSVTPQVLLTTTAPNGTYSFTNLLAGDYQVRFNGVGFGGNDNPNYLGQWWNDQPDTPNPTPNTIIVSSAPIANINAALLPVLGTHRMTISLPGPVAGTVSVQAEHLTCSSTCSHTFHAGVTFTLIASGHDSRFAGWGGDCRSAGTNTTCRVTLTSNTTVVATFAHNVTARRSHALAKRRAGAMTKQTHRLRTS